MTAEPGISASGHVHASAVLVGESAILVRGGAGSGKTALCLALLDRARAAGVFARLIGDDRVRLEARSGRLLVSAAPALAGLVERRGLGLAPIAHEARAVVALVIDCVGQTPPRMPDAGDLVTDIEGVTLPRLALLAGEDGTRLAWAAACLFGEPAWAR